ncbi:tetrathionate reductase subunit B [Jhaorihella thermophila]|uniref:Tetrathionate reductase subunit B n=1 Tax=Jhaorihella thermophila TaxID=488547 RepID=A0A1H5ZCY9_9RHOB|nr:tetrathionate reductase subunit B [Jhaorihella thermophila]
MKDYPDKPGISRRAFLGTGAAGAAAAGTLAGGDANSAVESKAKKKYVMVIDARRCYGVHACTVACKAEYKVPLGENRSWVEEIEKGNYPNVSRSFLPRLCNHCDEPACVSVCPTGATWKRDEDGIVVIDRNICIG